MKFNFPETPPSKTYGAMTTPEQDVIMKLVGQQAIESDDEDILTEAISFYQEAFKSLKAINLSQIKTEDLEEIFSFLRVVFNMNLTIQNKINFNYVYRVTSVTDTYLEDGKVRDVKYIKNAPLEIIEKYGVYGRANSPKSTIFYCAFQPGVAVFETKPKVNDRIIIAEWLNEGAKDFISYPITNNKTIPNESLESATKAFQDRMTYNHPLFATILDLYLDFLSSEFVKDIKVVHPKKYEYLFSAYFTDMVLDNSFKPIDHPVEPIKHYDCIIYPSIAIGHKYENLGILPESLKKLKPVKLQDIIVTETFYDYPQNIDDVNLPIGGTILRTATTFIGDRIVWDDDEKA
ncbi:hypothetical protein ACHRV1_14050 [Flavobacterium aquidurense]|uniref:hypothetical protein n=1 Tax=Flavobacterium aquidurense TaxID=362413 RepID=UPI00375729D8